MPLLTGYLHMLDTADLQVNIQWNLWRKLKRLMQCLSQEMRNNAMNDLYEAKFQMHDGGLMIFPETSGGLRIYHNLDNIKWNRQR